MIPNASAFFCSKNLSQAKPMPSFSIGHLETERIEVNLLGLAADPKKEGYDWIKASVHIEVGGLRGDVEITMCVSDMIRFKEQLEPAYRELSGVAEFKTIEGQLYVRVEVNRLGHVEATGYLRDDFTSGNKLNFEIHYDQTLLWRTISEVDKALFELSKKTA
jgi:hypothetical protein